jgi:hypothetical protein
MSIGDATNLGDVVNIVGHQLLMSSSAVDIVGGRIGQKGVRCVQKGSDIYREKRK